MLILRQFGSRFLFASLLIFSVLCALCICACSSSTTGMVVDLVSNPQGAAPSSAWPGMQEARRIAPSQELMVGAARLDISPFRPTIMGGYGVYMWSIDNCRWSDGVHDPIYATAMYISKNGGDLLIISLDLVGLIGTDMEEIKSRIADQNFISPERIIISSTHTHHSPDTIGLWGTLIPPETGRDEDYMSFMKARVVEAAGMALRSRRPAKLLYSAGELAGPHWNNYELKIENASLDDTLTLLQAVDENGDAIVTAMNWGCHPTTEDGDNLKISSDWVGAYYALMERRGAGVPMFLNGSVGASIQPSVPWRDEHVGGEGQGFVWAYTMGREVADAVSGQMQQMKELEFDSISVGTEPVVATMDNRIFALARTLGVLTIDLPEMHREFRTKVTAARLGGLTIATVPGELSPHLGMMIRQAYGGDAQMIVGLSQDYLGYIIDEQQYADDTFSYERMLCVGPDLGMGLVEAHRKLAKGM